MSSQDEEEDIIRNYLQELQEDLIVPFKDKKEQMGIKENLEDEIVTLFEDIQQKEEQLKQVLEIANILTSKKRELEAEKSIEIQNLENTLYEIQTSAEVTQQTANQYQRLYQESIDKNNGLQESLQQVEEQLQKQNNQHQIMKSELMQLKQKELKQSSNVDQKEFIAKLQQEIKNLEDQNKQYNQELKDLREQQKNLSHEYKVTVENVQKQQYENKNLKQNIDEQKIQICKMKNEIEQYQKYVEFQVQEKEELKQAYEQLQEKINNLEEDKQILQSELRNPSQFQNTMSDFRDVRDQYFSTYEEVQIDGTEQSEQFKQHFGVIEDQIKKIPSPEEFEQSQKKHKEQKIQEQKQEQEQKLKNLSLLKPKNKVSSSNASVLKTTKNTEQLQKVLQNNKNPHKLPGKGTEQKYKIPVPIKRDPYEEYFELVLQAVKLNSPYMDDVLGINTKNWYKQVQGELVPFHKWYIWVDQKVHNIRDELIKSREKQLLYTKRVIVF